MLDKYILFENNWEIDINALKFMWCSTKNWTDTIWKFWTGLKYAIAVLLRNNVKIEIFSWKTKIEFTTQEKIIWGKSFQQILMNWEEVWLTTSLWVEWELWQWVREFYANCLDENGKKLNWLWDRKWKPNKTRVFISKKEIEPTFEYFQFEWWTKVSEWLHYRKKKNKSPLKVFKEWFLVYQWTKNEESLYDYRMDHITVNESRLAADRWDIQWNIWEIISKMNFYSVNQIISASEYNLWVWYDNHILWDWWIQAVSARGWELSTWLHSLDVALKKLRSKKDKKYKYYWGYFWSWASSIIIEELWEIVIWVEQYKTFLTAFEEKDKRFDFDLQKNEIYINVKNKNDQRKLFLIITELIENIKKEKNIFIIELLERLYKDFN